MCPFGVEVSSDWLAPAQGSLGSAAGPEAARAYLVGCCCFSGPGAEIPLRPRCYLQGGKVRGPNRRTRVMLGEERSPWGRDPYFPSCAYCQAPGAFRPGDLLYLACRPCSAPVCLIADHIWTGSCHPCTPLPRQGATPGLTSLASVTCVTPPGPAPARGCARDPGLHYLVHGTEGGLRS